MKRILSIVLCLCLLFVTGCADKADEGLAEITLVLDWTPNTNHLGLYVAESLGYYEEMGLKVNIIQPPEGGAEALVAGGKAQLGVSFQDSMAPALCEDVDIVAVAAIAQHNLSGIISRKEKGIDSFKNMEGKTYATWGSPIEQSIIGYSMKKEGGDIKKLDMIDSTVTDVMMALDTDMVDCVWVYEYWDVVKAQLEGYEYSYIDFKGVDETMDYYTPVIITSGKYLDENYGLVEAFIEATKMGYEYASKNPYSAAMMLLEADKSLDEELIIKSAEFMADKFVDEKGEWGRIDADRWNRFYDWLYDEGLIEKDISGKGLYVME